LCLKKRHSALLVAHLESPNLSPRAPKEVPLGCALIGAFSGTTGRIGLVLTGPSEPISFGYAMSAYSHPDFVMGCELPDK
ncbi:MAG: hypothetical protein ABW141_16890, partial [Candidatus Thiodiazotropha endolucinida]